MKKYFSLLLILIFSINCVCVGFAQDTNIDVIYHGNKISCDVAPYYQNGRIMMPVRALFEAFGANVSWDDATQTATCTLGDTTVKMTYGASTYLADGTEYAMDAKVEKHSDRIFVPARYAAQSFGKKISYHQNSETAVVSDTNEYQYYENLTLPVPRFDFVGGSSFDSNSTLPNESEVYTYSCGENGLTDYLNFLQLDFGYNIYDMQYLDNAVKYVYAKDNHKISVTELWDDSGAYSVDIVPDIDGGFTLQKDEELPLEKSEEQPEADDNKDDIPVMDDITYSDADYGEITGASLIDVYTSENNKFYVYKYDMAESSYYEMYIEANGWQFYDYKIDIDTFGHSKYWVKDEVLLCLSVNYLYDIVMVSVIQ